MPWSWPSKGTTILSIPCAFQADSPSIPEWLLFPMAPFLHCPPSPLSRALQQDSFVLQKAMVPAVASRICLLHQCRQCQDQWLCFENCNFALKIYILALPFCSGNPDAVLWAAQGRQDGCHNSAGRGQFRIALPAAFLTMFWM